MKERPILFSSAMVRAILDSRKTQTRRLFKVAGGPITSPDEEILRFDDGSFHYRSTAGLSGPYPCRYGIPGDQLWVRETWAKAGEVADEVEYCADNPDPLGAKWRPSIHMPRWASRITLEVTGVRVERLQEISEVDSFAEGCLGVMGSARSQYEKLWGEINGANSWAENPWVWVIEFKRA